MNREDLDLEQLDQSAREFWQDDLAKFFPKQKEPTYTEYKMFQAGFQKAVEAYQKDYLILKSALKETKEQLKETVSFIESMERQIQ